MMESSGMHSSTSRSTQMLVWPIHSWQRWSTKSTSTGTSTLQRTRANWGRSHMRSMFRLEMVPLVVELRQLSKVHAPQGWGSGQGLFSAFSTASAWLIPALQLEQEQVHTFSWQLHRQPLVLTLQLQPQLLGSTGTIFSMTTRWLSSCCWLRQES